MTRLEWILGVALALGLALLPACSKSDETKSDDTSSAESSEGTSKSDDGAKTGGGEAKAGSSAAESESDACPGVCKRCFDAVVDACRSCEDDRDCDSPEDRCMTAKLLAQQSSCDTCASSLAREAATDDCK